MNVVFQDDIAEEHETALVLEELPGVEEDLNSLGSCENR